MTEPISLRSKIAEALQALKDGPAIFKKFKGDNHGPLLSTLYFWQEVSKIAESAEKASWKEIARSKAIAGDDELRELSTGEHILLESRQFSVIAELKSPQQRFDLETFIAAVSKKYKLDAGALAVLAEGCKKGGTAPLSKRVLSTGV
jgi:hypothetical protein